MTKCPYCQNRLKYAIELKVVEVDINTGKRRYVSPECGYGVWK